MYRVCLSRCDSHFGWGSFVRGVSKQRQHQQGWMYGCMVRWGHKVWVLYLQGIWTIGSTRGDGWLGGQVFGLVHQRSSQAHVDVQLYGCRVTLHACMLQHNQRIGRPPCLHTGVCRQALMGLLCVKGQRLFSSPHVAVT
jgi:hypothetical protein